MTPEEVRRIVREELEKRKAPPVFKFGDQVYNGVYGSGFVIQEIDGDGEIFVAFADGERTYFKPEELTHA